uniref:Focal AT domain-containing protein n=1 Tax=Bracon brevicornis TaxID=1563983 RepID=A0A6V7JJ46_9HYME
MVKLESSVESLELNNPNIEAERKQLEKKLCEQARQSEEDGRWLAREEKRLSIATSGDESVSPPVPRSINESPMYESSDKVNTSLSEGDKLNKVIVVKKMEPTPTADLDRSNDKVYDCTTNVVRAVMFLSQGVQQSEADQYLELVQRVGVELKSLLVTVDELINILPVSAHRQVEMAHKVLSKDMGDLVSAMKLAQMYSSTTLDVEYRKGMLAAAHVLAMDAKNLLDVIDSIRIRHPHVNIMMRKVGECVERGCSSDVVTPSPPSASHISSLDRYPRMVTNSLERNINARKAIVKTSSLERKRAIPLSNSFENSMSLSPVQMKTCLVDDAAAALTNEVSDQD